MRKFILALAINLIVMGVIGGCAQNNNNVTYPTENAIEEATLYYKNIESANVIFQDFVKACIDNSLEAYMPIIENSSNFRVDWLEEIRTYAVKQNNIYKIDEGFLGVFMYREEDGDHFTIRCLVNSDTLEIDAVSLAYNGVGL